MKEITVYSQPTCSKCQVLKKILDSKKIDYKVESNMEKILEIVKEVCTPELPIMTIGSDFKTGTRDYDVFSGSEAVLKGKEM